MQGVCAWVGLLVLMVVMVTGWKNGPDYSVCNQTQYQQAAKQKPPKKIPLMPDLWSVRVEVDMFDQGYSMDLHEFYDHVHNKGAVVKWEKGEKTKMIYDYDTDEIIKLMYDGSDSPPQCHIESLSSHTVDDYFGMTEPSNGTHHINPSLRALHFEGEGTNVPMNRTRGPDETEVDAWQACSYIESIDATLIVDWLFSADTYWSSPMNMVVPIQRSAKGVVHVNSSYSYSMDRRYLYTDFRILDRNTHPFETPPGTYCENRTSTRPLPLIPKWYLYSTEKILPLQTSVTWLKVAYDSELGLTIMESAALPTDSPKYGYNMIKSIQDFKIGLTFILDEVQGNCTVTPIAASAYGAKRAGNTDVTMMKPQEMLQLDTTHYYAGQRLVRDITTDVFVAEIADFPQTGVKSTHEVYFASRNWKENVGLNLLSNIPVRMETTSQSPMYKFHTIENIYDYSEGKPEIWKVDTAACFPDDQKHPFKLFFPVTHNTDVIADINGFKLAVVRTLMTYTDLSALRINDIEVEFPPGNLTVLGTLLGVPPVTGDVMNPKAMTTLKDAVLSVTNDAQQGFFTVTLPNGSGSLTATGIS